MKTVCVALLVALGLAGCAPYSADLNFSRAQNLGFRNGGLYSAGYLFVWNTKTNDLHEVGIIPLPKSTEHETPTDLQSGRVRGISISGEFGSSAEKIAAEAALGDKVSLTAKQAYREEYGDALDAMRKAYADAVLANGAEIAADRWQIEQVRRDRSLYYVLVNRIVRADQAVIAYGGDTGDEMGRFTLSVPGKIGSLKFSFKNGNTVECAGRSSPCFFDVVVAKPRGSVASPWFSRRTPRIDRLSAAFRAI